MAAIASSEFISLCQAQLQLLTAQMTAASAAVYMTDYLSGVDQQGEDSLRAYRARSRARNEPNFVPVVSYPESIETWIDQFERQQSPRLLSLPPAAERTDVGLFENRPAVSEQIAPADSSVGDVGDVGAADSSPAEQSERPSAQQASRRPSGQSASDHQLVIPLVYSDVVVGLIVAIRRDRAWKKEEQHYIEGIAQALAAGCVLERRSQWLQTQLTVKRDLQSRQSEIFHNLLHQFRNPLTAVTTFGQLLVRRLESEDPNQKIATGIVRESKRLREMVSHFDETVAIGDADLQADAAATGPAEPLLLPPVAKGLLPSSEAGSTLAGAAADAKKVSQTDADSPSASRLSASELSSEISGGLGHALTLSAQCLSDILEPILAVAEIVAKEKGVQVYSQVAVDTPAVWGEEEALGEVVSNLIDNAVKYSPVGACVFVQTGVSRSQGEHHYQGIVVADSGPGIPAADLTRLFERNYRGVQAEGNLPGTGLGLAIARALITQMQGTIEVVSPAVGTPWLPQAALPSGAVSGPGTVFIVWLPEVEAPANSAYFPTSVLR